MAQAARVIDLESFKSRRAPQKRSTPAAPPAFVWVPVVVWVPVWRLG